MNYPQIDVDDLAAIIRESMAAQQNENKQNGPAVAAAQTISAENRTPDLKLQPDFQPRSDDRYHINDLLLYHDRAFVQAAYRAILKRAPNEAEFLRDLQKLQSGQVNKIDRLATLRYSVEGRAKKVQLDGLTLPALIRRLGHLPLIGYFIRLGITFLRLPHLVRDQREFSGYVLSQHQQIADFINSVSARVTESRDGVLRLEESLSTLSTEYHALESRFERRIATEKQELVTRLDRETTERRAELDRSISEQRELLTTEIARLYLQLQHARAELTVQRSSLDALVSPRPTNLPAPQPVFALDALYAALEDRFRGSREEIKERFKVYLPYVKEHPAVLDLGCGRGEWLELLHEAGVEARGVDQNRIQIDCCRALGLNVREDDLLVYLRNLDDESAGAVTGFHIVEHVSLDTLVALLNEIVRVLRPGGVVIFETPNPENVLVGSHYFYLDPTHRHPLPSELMEFLLESRGFHGIEVLNLHPWDSARVKGDNDITNRFNDYFYGPMDYAIVGRKVEA